MKTLTTLLDTLPQAGRVEWIGLRPDRRADMQVVETATAIADHGLKGDRYSKRGGDRQVTLIQAEHLIAVASMLGTGAVTAESVRRNIVVSGVNLLALKDKTFELGDATLAYSGLCHPCSLMESTLGPGGYNAMRGHGGITARVLKGGEIELGDSLRYSGSPCPG
ncbi:MAG: MOSC domain-containing protein [Woeseiaceae bacterium]|nr:MOSC domain-containing protein [Woeseiaceae bacterium]